MRGPARLLALAAALAACAGPAARKELGDAEAATAPPAEVARDGFEALLRGDGAAAGRRFAEAVRRDPADPWARLGAAWVARRSLDDAGEERQLAALVGRAPDHPLAAVAARRLGELAELSPALAEAVEAALAPPLAQGRLAGLAASRARVARVQAAEALGDQERAARLRAENGSVASWTLLGPCSPWHALEFSRPLAPERGALPARLDGPPGLPPAEARPLLTGDGLVSLEGEPAEQGDVFYLAADLRAARGGDYLVAVGATGELAAWIDGEPLAERRTAEGFPPTAQVVPRRLAAGSHRLLVKLARFDGAPARMAVSLARADGAPSDVRAVPAPPGAPAAAAREGPPPPPVNLPARTAALLEPEAGPVLACWVAVRDGGEVDREGAKRLLAEALALRPDAAPLLSARAALVAEDPTLDGRTARGEAEGLLDRALAADPGNSAARVRRAETMRGGEQPEEAAALLAGLPPEDAGRPRARMARARVALARGFAEGAEREAEEAWRDAGSCAAGELLLDLAERRDAAARAAELAQALTRCAGGRSRLAEHLRRRGEAARVVELVRGAVAAAPSRPGRRLELAGALVATGDLAGAAAQVEEAARDWPRDPRLPRRLAEIRELAGDAAGARAARERALALDGADLPLRRALAAERGGEPLDDLDEDGAAALAAYRRAAPPAGSSGTYVLDLGAVEAYPDGSCTERVHQVVQLDDQRAVDRFGEVQVPQGAELLRARTLKRDGRVLEAEERGDKGTVSLPGVEPGDAGEWDWLRAVPSRGAALPGFAPDGFFFRGDLPMWRTTYAVEAPAGTGLRIDARRLDPAPAVERAGGRERVRVAHERVPAVRAEPGAPSGTEFLPMIQVGAGAGPEALPLLMADALSGAALPSLEIRRLARAIEASVPEAGRTGEPLLRAAFARVGELVQGAGGSLADQAGHVLSRRRGSRLLLLQAVLRVLGWQAHLALAREFARDPAPALFPRVDAYSVPLLLVERGDRRWWLDASARQVPFGAIPGAVRGTEAAVLPLPGEAPRTLPLPADDGRERRSVELKVRISAGGDAEVEGTEHYVGFDAAAYKLGLERMDAQQRRQRMEQLLSRGFRGARLEALSEEGESDPEAPLTVRWRIAVPSWARVEPDGLVIDSPVLPPRLQARYAPLPARETPLLVASPERLSMRLEVTPPPGYRAVARPSQALQGSHGSYARSERVEGGALVREDRFELVRGRVAPAAYADFASFAAAVDEAQGAPMLFRGAPASVAGAPDAGAGGTRSPPPPTIGSPVEPPQPAPAPGVPLLQDARPRRSP